MTTTLLTIGADGKASVAGSVKPDLMATPNYAAMETTNRITANGGSWTADRTGWVRWQLHANNALANTPLNCRLLINGQVVDSGGDSDGMVHHYFGGTAQVSEGDVVTISAVGDTNSTSDVANVDSVHCYFIPPMYVSATPPSVTEDFLNTAMIPDYANAEYATNLLPDPPANVGTGATGGAIAYTLEGTWTADRTGFVFAKIFAYITEGLSGGRAVFGTARINGKLVGEFQSGDGLGQVTGGHRLENTGVYPINIGDVFTTRIYRWGSGTPEAEKWESSTVNLRHYLYFIPPKFVTVQAPNIVVSGASYSNTEQLTGETWVNGKPIYRRVVYRNTGSIQILDHNNDGNDTLASNIFGSAFYVDEVLDLRFSCVNPSNYFFCGSAFVSMNSGNSTHFMYETGGDTIRIRKTGADTYTNLTIIMHYTKTTD
jgi:hypothetical protein